MKLELKEKLNEYFFSHATPVLGFMGNSKPMITQSLHLGNFTINGGKIRQVHIKLYCRGNVAATSK